MTSQFSYCPLIWISHSRILNKFFSDDNQSSFKELLEKDHSLTNYTKTILVAEVKSDTAPDILRDIFGLR